MGRARLAVASHGIKYWVWLFRGGAVQPAVRLGGVLFCKRPRKLQLVTTYGRPHGRLLAWLVLQAPAKATPISVEGDAKGTALRRIAFGSRFRHWTNVGADMLCGEMVRPWARRGQSGRRFVGRGAISVIGLAHPHCFRARTSRRTRFGMAEPGWPTAWNTAPILTRMSREYIDASEKYGNGRRHKLRICVNGRPRGPYVNTENLSEKGIFPKSHELRKVTMICPLGFGTVSSAAVDLK